MPRRLQELNTPEIAFGLTSGPRPHTEPSRSSILIGRRWWQGTSTSTQVCVQCTESRTMHATKQGSGMCYSRALKN